MMPFLFGEPARRPLRHFRRWLRVGWLLIITIIILELIPEPQSELFKELTPNDKIEHFIAYGTLMAWFVQLYHPLRTRIVLALLFIGMGVGLEFLQGLTFYRTFDVYDMLANSIGVLLGLMLSFGSLGQLLARFESRPQRAE